MVRARRPPLHHLAFRTRDIDALAAFYERWLGLPIVRDLRPKALWLGVGPGAVLMIERARDGEPSPAAGGLDLFAIRVSPRERARLRAELASEGRLEEETEHTLYFRDPDGRRVGASTYPLAVR
jgi:catechol 2,3-dioxygenase-like lactoylglutathione lyase family enzyme